MSLSESEAQLQDQDSIYVRNLSLPFPILAPNAWGDVKAQPGTVSLALHFGSSFESAANKDRLDESTVHYGILAKRVRGICREGMAFGELLKGSFKVAEDLTNGTLARCQVEVKLPKCSMLGEAVEVIEKRSYGASAGHKPVRALRFLGVTVPVLIGVNDYERRRKQPLVIDITADLRDEDLREVLFSLEDRVVQVIEGTSFETLETLVDFTAKELRETFLDQHLPGGRFGLRILKPMAITFADAPVVEIWRRIPTRS